MSKIRILSDSLASQVAAGEVVERPAAVVRELVENSLDAGAAHVAVHVQRGGTALIRIVDDGSGMSREDAMLCIERHATSKIRTKEDLSAIGTFGFRGEALPSIASVSRFKISTRPAEALTGTEIEIHGGKMHSVSECGGPAGTSIEVRSIFFNVPARRKFLRTESTEYAHVEQQFRLHAIAHPGVAFTLTRDGQTVFHLPATRDDLERIRGLIGDLADRLVEVEPFEHRGVRVSGHIGGPGVSRSTRQMQLTFLNGRPIESPSISYGLREGYHTVLMKGQHPVTFLRIDMDGQEGSPFSRRHRCARGDRTGGLPITRRFSKLPHRTFHLETPHPHGGSVFRAAVGNASSGRDDRCPSPAASRNEPVGGATRPRSLLTPQ